MKTIHHTENEENSKWNKKRQSADANIEITQMLELSDKDFKAVIIKMFQQALTNMLETNEKKYIASTKTQKVSANK